MIPLVLKCTPRTGRLCTYDINFTAIGPITLVRLPCGGPRSATLGHVSNVKASDRKGLRTGRVVIRIGNVHGDVGGIGLDTTDTNTVSSRATGIQHSRVIRAQNERIAVCVGQVFSEGRSFIDVVSTINEHDTVNIDQYGTYTRPCVGSAMASKVKLFRKPEPT